jgi:hypothetical protein
MSPAVALLASGILFLVGGCAMAASSSSFYEVVEKLAGSPPATSSAVEKALSVKLVTLEDEPDSKSYEAKDQNIGGVKVERVDYRESGEKGPGRDGPLLILWLDDDCVSKNSVMENYQNLQITSRPTGHSPDESTAYTKRERWGELSFTFTERNPDCLGTVVFAHNPIHR